MENEPHSAALLDASLGLAAALNQFQIQYALIGGLAAGYRTHPRFTRDIDFLLSIPQLVLPPLLQDLQRRAFEFDTATTIRGRRDHFEFIFECPHVSLRDPNALVAALGDFEKAGLLAGVRVNEEEGVLTAAILETPPPALTPELQARQSLKLAANVMFTANIVRLWGVNREALEKVVRQITEKIGSAIAQTHSARGPAQFRDIFAEGITIARAASSNEEALERFREGFSKFIEGKWLNQPLKSLGGVSPSGAAGNASLRKKLRGVVQILRECAVMAKIPYDFEPLLRKLGLAGAPASAATTGGAPACDFAAMNAAELAGVQAASLSAAEVEQAYQAALKLDARELAGAFAADLVGRPPYAERADRYPLFQLLINQALAKGETTAALDRVNEGEKDDCENNGGKRRNDYELRRAQVHAKGGEFDQAEQVFDRLIARAPSELQVRVSAAETMLSARQSAKARKYAEQGLAEAVKLKNRDLEGHFKELMAAAQK